MDPKAGEGKGWTPHALREAIRQGQWRTSTSGLCPGFVQANVVILDAAHAEAFEQFCRINSRACPLLAVGSHGNPGCPTLAADADIRTDVPRYRIYRNGSIEFEIDDIASLFGPSSVAFYLGCSFSFEEALIEAGVPVRNIEQKKNVSMYRTNRQCESVGVFQSALVVSMRPIPQDLVQRTVTITQRFTDTHGAPIHWGDPAALGIVNLAQPDFGDAVDMCEGDVPVFWACGVTAILAASQAPMTITHSPGCMFVTDIRSRDCT